MIKEGDCYDGGLAESFLWWLPSECPVSLQWQGLALH